VRIALTIDDAATSCAGPPAPAKPGSPQASSIIDDTAPIGYAATGPRDPAATDFSAALFCSTSEVFGVARDNPGPNDALNPPAPAADWAGVKAINYPSNLTLASLGDVDALATQGPVFKTQTASLSLPSNTTAVTVTAQAQDFAGKLSPSSPATLVNRTGLTSTSKDVQPCKSFTDVAGTEWFAVYVRYLGSAGLIAGFPDGSFRPNDPVTRGQAATAINRLKDASDKDATSGFVNESVVKLETRTLRGDPPFTDVPLAAFYTDAVKRLYNIGVVDGTSPTTFSPDAQVTRGQIAKMLYRALGRWFPLS